MTRVVAWVGLIAAGGCGATSDHERLGDDAFRERRFAKALVEYQAAQRSGARSRVWAKAGAAAIEAQDYRAAIESYSQLAAEDPTRAAEAAAAIERVARFSERQSGEGGALLLKAALALRTISPNRPLGRLAVLSVADSMTAGDGLGLLPTALANAATPRGVDSLLLQLADMQRATVACEAAARSYQTVLRRTDAPRVRTAAREGLAECALLLGRDALAAKDGQLAERWYSLVLGLETETRRSWHANLGLGDARLLQGDALGAAVAYQAVLGASAVPDSVRQAAASKLNELGAATAQPPADGDQ